MSKKIKKELTAFISRMRDVAQLDDTSAGTRDSLNSHADQLAAMIEKTGF